MIKEFKKFDLYCFDKEIIGSYIDELTDIFEKNTSIIKDHDRKTVFKNAYTRLHKNWYKKHLSWLNWISIVGTILSFVAMVFLDIKVNFLPVIAMFCSIIVILNFIKEYSPSKYDFSKEEVQNYSDAQFNVKYSSELSLMFKERYKVLTIMEKYNNACAVLEKIAKERNTTVDELYKEYIN